MIKEATDLGALMHFTKPFDIDELRVAVNHYLHVSQAKAVGS
jgi:two-component system response regulator (stage 0 sporulation protein F)